MRVALPFIRVAANDMISRHSSTVSELNSPVFPQGVITLTPAARRKSRFSPRALKSIERSEPNGVILIPTIVSKRAPSSFGCFKGFDGWGVAFSMLHEAQKIGSRLSSPPRAYLGVKQGQACGIGTLRPLRLGMKISLRTTFSNIFTKLTKCKKNSTLKPAQLKFKRDRCHSARCYDLTYTR